MAQTIAELEAKLTLTTDQFRAELGRLDSLIGGAAMTVGKMAAAVAGAELSLAGLQRAVSAVEDAVVGFNSMLERAQLSFTYLVGGADAAREHLNGLIQMARSTPFPVEQFITASRALQGLGMNAAFVPSTLKTIADAAAAMDVPLDQATQAIGRFMSMIAGGQGGIGGIGQGARQLMTMGLISGPFLAEIRQMEAAGASAQEILNRFLGELGRFDGAAASAATTWSGLVVKIRDTLTEMASAGFKPIFDRLEQMRQHFLATFQAEQVKKNLEEFSRFAVAIFDRIGEAISKVAGFIQTIGSWLGKIDEMLGRVPPGTFTQPAPAGAAGGAGVGVAAGGGTTPTGPMFQVLGPSIQQQEALKEAQRILASLNPTLDENDKKVLELAHRFAELAQQGGQLAGQIKALGVEAGQAALFFGQMEVFTKITEDFRKSMPTWDEQGKQIDEIRQKYELASTRVIPELRQAVVDLGETLIGSIEKFAAEKRALDGLTASWEASGAAARDFQQLEDKLTESHERYLEALRAGEAQGAALQQQVGIFRAAGVPGQDLTGAMQAALQQQITAITQQRAAWNQEMADVEAGSQRFRELSDWIDEADKKLVTLTTDLGRLQELNTLKGIVSDAFGAMNRATSTMITGVIQGTTTMKDAFNNLGQSILLSIQEMLIKRAFKQLEEAFNSMLDSMDTRAVMSTALRFLTSLFPSLSTPSAPTPAPVSSEPGAMQHGGIVTSPRRVLVGEAGPEAVIPLDSANARQYLGGGSAMVQVTVINNASGTEVETKESTGPMGQRQIEISINGIVKKGMAQGEYDRMFQSTFGVTRQGINR